jgi:hypothetical protein
LELRKNHLFITVKTAIAGGFNPCSPPPDAIPTGRGGTTPTKELTELAPQEIPGEAMTGQPIDVVTQSRMRG